MGNRQLKVGVILSYLIIVLGNIISLLYTPIMLRLLGQSEYGLFTLANSTVGFLGIMSLGLGSVIIRYAVKYKTMNDKDSEYSLYGMFLIIYSVIAVIVCVIGLIMVVNVDAIFANNMTVEEISKIRIIMILMIGNFAISLPFSIFTSAMMVYEKFVFPKLITLFSLILNPIIMLLLLDLGYKAVTMTIVTVIFSMITLFINSYYCFIVLKVKIRFKKWNSGFIKEIANYTFFIALGLIVDRVFWNTDQFILGMASGTAAVAVYSIGAQFNNYYMSFSTAISGVFLPKVTGMVAEGALPNDVSKLFIRTGRIQFIIMALILSGFTLYGKEFIVLWAGQNYEMSYYIALVVMYPLTIPLIQGLGLSILQAKNKHAFRSIVYFIIAIINVIASVYLVKYWGGFGCAIASAGSFLIGHGLIMNIYYYKKININIPQFWKEIIKMSFPVLISMVVGFSINIIFTTSSIIFLILKINLFLIVYAVLIWFMGLNNYEKDLFLKPLLKIIHKLKKEKSLY